MNQTSKLNNSGSITGNSTLIEAEKKQLEKIKQRQVIKLNKINYLLSDNNLMLEKRNRTNDGI